MAYRDAPSAFNETSFMDWPKEEDLILGQFENSQNANNLSLPIREVSNIQLGIRSLPELREHLANERPLKSAMNDLSYPYSDEAKQAWVKALVWCLNNEEDAVDSPALLRQWRNMIRDGKVNLEVAAWSFLETVMYYHCLVGRLDPTDPDTSKAKKWDCFNDHMVYMLDIFKTRKSLCRHMARDMWTCSFIDGPEIQLGRADNNRTVNGSKKAKNQAGHAALEYIKNCAKDGLHNGADMQAVMDIVPNPTIGTRHVNTSASQVVTPQTQRRSSRTNTPKFIRKSDPSVKKGMRSKGTRATIKEQLASAIEAQSPKSETEDLSTYFPNIQYPAQSQIMQSQVNSQPFANQDFGTLLATQQLQWREASVPNHQLSVPSVHGFIINSEASSFDYVDANHFPYEDQEFSS